MRGSFNQVRDGVRYEMRKRDRNININVNEY